MQWRACSTLIAEPGTQLGATAGCRTERGHGGWQRGHDEECGSSRKERRLDACAAADGAAGVVGTLDGGIALTADRVRAAHASLSPTARWGTRVGRGSRQKIGERREAHSARVFNRRLAVRVGITLVCFFFRGS